MFIFFLFLEGSGHHLYVVLGMNLGQLSTGQVPYLLDYCSSPWCSFSIGEHFSLCRIIWGLEHFCRPWKMKTGLAFVQGGYHHRAHSGYSSTYILWQWPCLPVRLFLYHWNDAHSLCHWLQVSYNDRSRFPPWPLNSHAQMTSQAMGSVTFRERSNLSSSWTSQFPSCSFLVYYSWNIFLLYLLFVHHSQRHRLGSFWGRSYKEGTT